MNFLVVDDQPSTLNILHNILLETWPDATIYCANQGHLALEIIQEKPLDIVLSDWQMPGLDGLALIKEISRLKPDLPVILYSGLLVEATDLEIALGAGAIDYLRKPLDKVEVIARIRSALKMSQALLKLKKHNQSKDVIFSMLANHLINDTTQTGMALEIIMQTPNKTLDFVTRILSETQQVNTRQQQLLKHLLSWTTLRFGERQVLLQTFPVRDFLVSCLKVFNDQHPNLKLRVNRDLQVRTDPQLVAEIMAELLSNAVTACPEGMITVIAQQKNDRLWVAVQDQGEGLTSEQLNLLLLPLFEQNITLSLTNRGLGLQICHELLDLLNSRLEGHSKIGGGSCFGFYLPHQVH